MRNKLSKVLWIPVQGEREIPLAERCVGYPLLWSPSPEEEAQLKADWEELMELIVLGKVAQITAKHGEVLQLRPKAANGRALTEAYGANGRPIKTLPRVFICAPNLLRKFCSAITPSYRHNDLFCFRSVVTRL